MGVNTAETLCTWPNGDILTRGGPALIARFAGPRRTLSTSPLGGGCREELTAVFNHDCAGDPNAPCGLRGATMEEHLALTARDLGLDPARCTGLCTAAQMRNAAVCAETFYDVSVTAAVTAGLDGNAGRAGDPAGWHELRGASVPLAELPERGSADAGAAVSPGMPAGKKSRPPLGTVNLLLFFSADLTPGALARALVTATEAKAAALQELCVASVTSHGIATGSGTDGTILVADSASPVRLTEAGKHYKLGELIGRVVTAAVKEALFRQTELSPARQHNALCRMQRFGVTADTLWASAQPAGAQSESRAVWEARLALLAADDTVVALTALYARLLDEVSWGLLGARAADSAAALLLRGLADAAGAQAAGAQAAGALIGPGFTPSPWKPTSPVPPPAPGPFAADVARLTADYSAALLRLLS